MLKNSWISVKIIKAASTLTLGHSPNLNKYTLSYDRLYKSSFPPTQKPYNSTLSPITTRNLPKYKISTGTMLSIKRSNNNKIIKESTLISLTWISLNLSVQIQQQKQLQFCRLNQLSLSSRRSR